MAKVRTEEEQANWDERAERIAKEQREAFLDLRAGRGPASSMKYGAKEDREAAIRGDRPLPGITVPSAGPARLVPYVAQTKEGEYIQVGWKATGGEQVFIPPAQKYSSIKREREEVKAATYQDLVSVIRSMGVNEIDARDRAGRLLAKQAMTLPADIIKMSPTEYTALIKRMGREAAEQGRQERRAIYKALTEEEKAKLTPAERKYQTVAVGPIVRKAGEAVPEKQSVDDWMRGEEERLSRQGFRQSRGALMTQAQYKAIEEMEREERAALKKSRRGVRTRSSRQINGIDDPRRESQIAMELRARRKAARGGVEYERPHADVWIVGHKAEAQVPGVVDRPVRVFPFAEKRYNPDYDKNVVKVQRKVAKAETKARNKARREVKSQMEREAKARAKAQHKAFKPRPEFSGFNVTPMMGVGALAIAAFGAYTLYKVFQADKPEDKKAA